MEGIKVLSLFDGISCGRVALERCGIKVDKYFASEIDKHAIKVATTNFPDTIEIGDITKVHYKDGTLFTQNGEYYVGKIDLLLGGSPCQSISNLGDGTGLEGKSGLFYHYLRIKEEVKPKSWLLENVCGKASAITEMSKLLGVEPTKIDSNLVSGANRKRLYWSNLDQIYPPTDRQINLVDVLQEGLPQASVLSEGRLRWFLSDKGQQSLKKGYCTLDAKKAGCLTARSDASWNSNYVTRQGKITKLTPEEYEKLQTLPMGYTSMVSSSNRYKAIGNGWTVDVIAHILPQILHI